MRDQASSALLLTTVGVLLACQWDIHTVMPLLDLPILSSPPHRWVSLPVDPFEGRSDLS